MKPGWQTSEFWATLGGMLLNVVTVLVLLGWVKSEDARTLTDAVQQLLATLPVLLANAAIIWRYIAARTGLKTAETKEETIRMESRMNMERVRMGIQTPPAGPTIG